MRYWDLLCLYIATENLGMQKGGEGLQIPVIFLNLSVLGDIKGTMDGF